MNPKIKGQLQLMFEGLSERLMERTDDFVEIRGAFGSGTKEFPFRAGWAKENEEDRLTLSFLGKKEVLPPGEVLGKLLEASGPYERLTLYFTERAETRVLEAGAKGVRMRTEEGAGEAAAPKSAHITDRVYKIEAGKAAPLLKEIGIMSLEGKILNDKIRKYNQIDHFIELVEPMILGMPEDKTLVFLDCGCGKSYLSFALNYYVTEVLKRRCRFVGLDISKGVIEASKERALRLGYRNMTFVETDISQYQMSERPDMVLSLHACDTATDMALAAGIRAGAKAIVAVPCCHKELLKQMDFEEISPLLRQGIFKKRVADTLTDALRALKLEAEGYRVRAMEYISPLETPKNLMLQAEKTGSPREGAKEEYEAMKRILGASPALERLLNR